MNREAYRLFLCIAGMKPKDETLCFVTFGRGPSFARMEHMVPQ